MMGFEKEASSPSHTLPVGVDIISIPCQPLHLLHPYQPLQLTLDFWNLGKDGLYLGLFSSHFGFDFNSNAHPPGSICRFIDNVNLGPMGLIMVEDIGMFLGDRPALASIWGALSWFGDAVSAVQGIDMANKELFSKVLGLSMVFIAFIYACVEALGCVAFEEKTKHVFYIYFGSGVIRIQVGSSVHKPIFQEGKMDYVATAYSCKREMEQGLDKEGRPDVVLQWLPIIAIDWRSRWKNQKNGL